MESRFPGRRAKNCSCSSSTRTIPSTCSTVARRKPAIVDISAVEILASIGVGMLVKNARSMHSYGLIFGVVATGLSKEILERLKVDTIFPVVATYEDALRTLMLE